MSGNTTPVLTVLRSVGTAGNNHNADGDVVYVYEMPVRLWHWINAAATVVLALTGYFIGSAVPTMPGEASDKFLFGYIRFAHFSAGYVLSVGFLLRIYWAIMGNSYAKEIFCVPIWRRGFLDELWQAIRWYAFLSARSKKTVGHNPAAQLMMFSMFTLTTAFMIATGFALYAQGSGGESWQFSLFGWVFAILPNSQDVHTSHHLGLWVIVTFVLIHIYAAIREDIMSRRSISAMISGERDLRD
ncbi:Ni/Fe-hydrogenase, b-type cytochrome subunit [Bradyrhizobium sp. CCGE-LA001]|uniref:Ni/Fe-hydrogenase, b-type cytochrome subunit n=1 Tax=Bradyrhizobium sp. CCGE-LA001 TaxID=1223566 RepID=UPI0002E20C36|nr:Ni/Fe-hydrogenase, b-type cytochrome subunit [Bradyrhizobium sp. CCGE-LA001]AMA60250.1 Ni/Fe hydrogenase 1 b-type cytochrome subunit [Bradyrhizobium sp. CCGE-LA001]